MQTLRQGFLGMGIARRQPPQLAALSFLIAGALLAFMVYDRWENPSFRDPYWAYAVPLAMMMAAALWGSLASWWRLRALMAAPLLRIADVPVGCYAKIHGRAEPLEGALLDSPASNTSCCWYSYQFLGRKYPDGDNDGYSIVEQGVSEARFMVRDASGACVVDPTGAEVTGSPFEQQNRMNHISLESVIVPGDRLVVEGKLVSEGPEREVRAAASRLVLEWKKDMPGLLRRFDTDGDGALSQREWDAVLAEARRQAEHEAASRPPRAHFAGPRDGRPYLISVKSEEQLDLGFKCWLGGHLLGLFAAAMCLAGVTAHYWRTGYWH